MRSLKYLGFIINEKGMMPNPDKVKAIQAFPRPRTVKQLRSHLGAINFFRRFIPHVASILAPVNQLTKKNNEFKWTDDLQERLDAAKSLLANTTLLVYPNFNKPFHIYTDASDYGLGVVVFQYDDDNIPNPIYFYSKKFNDAQLRYTVVHKEALAAISIFKHLRKMLFGCSIHLYTDSLNLSYLQTSSSMKLQRYFMEIVDFHPVIEHVAGVQNVVADFLSRMDFQQKYIELMTIDEFPLAPTYVQSMQNNDEKLQELVLSIKLSRTVVILYNKTEKLSSDDFQLQELEGAEVLCLKNTYQQFIPLNIRKDLLTWFHEFYAHPGVTRMEKIIRIYAHWKSLNADIRSYTQKCHTCQINKVSNKRKYGKLSESTVDINIGNFEVVAFDLVGPLPKSISHTGEEYEYIFTIIDIKTRFIELIPLYSTTGPVITQAFDDNWLCRYPRPSVVLTDQVVQFKREINECLESFGIKHQYTTAYNPQCNSICERAHSTLNDHIRCVGIDNWHTKLQPIAWSMRSMHHTSLGTTPGNLVFHRDMILVPKVQSHPANNKRKKSDLDKQNSSRIQHNYEPGQLVLVNNPKAPKFGMKWFGPFKVIEAKENANYLTIERTDLLNENVNYRRIVPYNSSTGGQNVVVDMNDMDDNVDKQITQHVESDEYSVDKQIAVWTNNEIV